MDRAAKNKLKTFLEENIPIEDLMRVGFFPKGTKKNSYEKIAERVCCFFSFKNIYEYKKVCTGLRCDGKNCDGRNKHCKNYIQDVQVWKKLEIYPEDMASQDSWLN